jgi:hypothetical protein
MKPAMRSLTPGSHGGSHTEVFSLDSDRLGSALAELAARHGGSPERAKEVGARLARRFLVKVGNIANYVIKLKGGAESVIRRTIPSEAFGNVGYNMAPTIEKVRLDTREAVREIPYFGFGDPAGQFAPDVLAEARAAAAGASWRGSPRDGVFLVEDDPSGRRARNAWQVLEEDPFFEGRVGGFTDLVRFQEHLRENPLEATLKERLSDFFESPITVGFRDTLRYLEGARHPAIGWRRAEAVIRACFADHGTENFLPPEINYYTRSIWLDADEVALREAGNREAASAFTRWMVERLPFAWTAPLPDREMEAIARGVLDLHFDYPVFEVEPYTGIVSTATARLLLRVAAGIAWHLSDSDVPERRNPLTPALAARVRPLAAFLERLSGDDRAEFCNTVNGMLWEVAIRGGVRDRDGRVHPYRRIDRTFYSFQERAQCPVEARGVVEEVLTLEDLLRPEGRALLEARPEVARKLVVFFVLIYRYFLDTGHVPDLRPDDAGRDLFLRGIWGYSTKNVLIVAGRGRNGRPIDAVRFVDNKDHFKQYRRAEDRARPMGLAKYGLRLVHPLIQPAMERSIGLYTGIVARAEGASDEAPIDPMRHAARVTNQVLREGVDGAITHIQAFLHDAIDDTTDGLDRMLGGKS